MTLTSMLFFTRQNHAVPKARSNLMSKSAVAIIYVVLMIAVIITMDIIFFRHRFQQRLIANIVTVIVFAIIYLIFLRRI